MVIHHKTLSHWDLTGRSLCSYIIACQVESPWSNKNWQWMSLISTGVLLPVDCVATQEWQKGWFLMGLAVRAEEQVDRKWQEATYSIWHLWSIRPLMDPSQIKTAAVSSCVLMLDHFSGIIRGRQNYAVWTVALMLSPPFQVFCHFRNIVV